jgi:hypothetical protein
MFNRLIPWVAALVAFVVVGLLVFGNQNDIAIRNAEGIRNLCYLNHGFSGAAKYEAPKAVIAECTQSMARYNEATWFYFVGAGAGLIAAVMVLGIFYLLRRKKPVA